MPTPANRCARTTQAKGSINDPSSNVIVSGMLQRAQLYVYFRHANVFGKSAGIEMGRPQQVADRLMSGQTVAALAAGHMMRGKNPIADFEVFDPLPHLGHFAGNLMTQNKRRLFDPIPLHQIAAANAARACAQSAIHRDRSSERPLLQAARPGCCSTWRRASWIRIS